MNKVIHLRQADIVANRPFTHPDYVTMDRAVLCYMIDDFCQIVRQQGSQETDTTTYYFPDAAPWQKRVIVPRNHALQTQRPFTIVGFFGRLQHNITPAIATEIWKAGQLLIDSFQQVTAVLGYYTRLLVDELNYANLVLLDGPEAIAAWRTVSVHPYATAILSPQYYAYVRIYNGHLPAGGLHRSELLHLHVVKYWDYRQSPAWQAIRSLGE